MIPEEMTHISIRQRIALELHRQLVKDEQKHHPLRQLFWECTLRCNMHCRHCGSDCHVSSACTDMPFEDFRKVLVRIKEKYDSRRIMVIMTGGEPVGVTVDRILEHTAKKFGVTVDDIKGTKRNKEIAYARHVAIYLMRKLTDMSLPQIGRILKRDHIKSSDMPKFVERLKKISAECEIDFYVSISASKEDLTDIDLTDCKVLN